MKRTAEVKEAHQQHAKKLLDMGLQKADVSATLQRKYGLSRATAFRDVDEADLSREVEDHKIETDPVPMISLEDRDALILLPLPLSCSSPPLPLPPPLLVAVSFFSFALNPPPPPSLEPTIK